MKKDKQSDNMDKFLNKITHIDAMEGLRQLPDKSIDLICIDPPYNINKAEWDKIDNYIEWMGTIFKECERVLRNNGSLYWFHNKMSLIHQLMYWLYQNTDFKLKSFIVWDKKNFRANVWKYPGENNTLRSWFNTCEFIMFYTFHDITVPDQIFNSRETFYSLKEYMRTERKRLMDKLGLKNKNHFAKYMRKLNISTTADRHYFSDSQWIFPSKEMYEKLQTTGFFKKRYEELRKEYKELMNIYQQKYKGVRYTFNLDKHHNNVWQSKYVNNSKRHPTEKPIDIIKRIIKCSSNPGDIVLDCFSGSGTTAEVCIDTNRNFICFENNEQYIKVSQERITSFLNNC